MMRRPRVRSILSGGIAAVGLVVGACEIHVVPSPVHARNGCEQDCVELAQRSDLHTVENCRQQCVQVAGGERREALAQQHPVKHDEPPAPPPIDWDAKCTEGLAFMTGHVPDDDVVTFRKVCMALGLDQRTGSCTEKMTPDGPDVACTRRADLVRKLECVRLVYANDNRVAQDDHENHGTCSQDYGDLPGRLGILTQEQSKKDAWIKDHCARMPIVNAGGWENDPFGNGPEYLDRQVRFRVAPKLCPKGTPDDLNQYALGSLGRSTLRQRIQALKDEIQTKRDEIDKCEYRQHAVENCRAELTP
jgi:hypothetical protein